MVIGPLALGTRPGTRGMEKTSYVLWYLDALFESKHCFRGMLGI